MDNDHLPDDRYSPPSNAIHTDGLGLFSGSLGSGHRRFWFVPRDRTAQSELFDRVSGLLLREVKTAMLVRALYLYPPGTTNENIPAMEAFMLLLGTQPIAAFENENDEEAAMSEEYDRLTRLCISEVADLERDHWPATEPS
jgi:hypothetical protein